MKKYIPLLATCCVVIPAAVLIGLFIGAQFGRWSGFVGLIAILLIAGYSRGVSAAKKLDR